MARLIATLTVLFSFASLPLVAGCDHEVKHDSTTVRHSDGTVTHEDTTVTRKPNGDVVTEQNKQNNP